MAFSNTMRQITGLSFHNLSSDDVSIKKVTDGRMMIKTMHACIHAYMRRSSKMQ